MTNRVIEWLSRKLQKLLNNKYFDSITGLISVLNPIVVALQLYTVLTVENVEGVSISMWFCFILIQLTFALVAVKAKNFGMTISMALSVLISMSIIITTLIKL